LVKKIMVATDRSASASRAVDWAADMAERFGAELHLLQVLVPEQMPGTEAGAAEATRTGFAAQELSEIARKIAGIRGKAHVIVDTDPSRGIVRAADDADVDVLVVGNVGMAGRKEFLLGNVPNRVSHNARCTVIIVNTAGDGQVRPTTYITRGDEPEQLEVEGRLLGRAADIGKVMA
jgi:ubiquinone biosynthesis protein